MTVLLMLVFLPGGGGGWGLEEMNRLGADEMNSDWCGGESLQGTVSCKECSTPAGSEDLHSHTRSYWQLRASAVGGELL